MGMAVTMLTDGVKESLDKIFAGIIVGGMDLTDLETVEKKREAYRMNIPRFLGRFSSNIFLDEYAFLYEVIKTLNIKCFSENQMLSIADNNIDLILKSPYIDLSKFDIHANGNVISEEEKIEAFKYFLVELFNKLSNQICTEIDFESACNIYIDFYKDALMKDTVQEMAMIMSATGFEEKQTLGRKKSWKGLVDAQKYYVEKSSIIKAFDEENQVRHTLIDEEWLLDEAKKDTAGDDSSIIDFDIKEIDDVVGKLRRGNMIEFMGPPKGGKTTVATFLAERCLEKKLNVAIWVLDGDKSEWNALFQALIVRKFKDGAMSLNRKNVQDRIYADDNERHSVLAARQILATDNTRGKLSYISGTAYVEDFDEILTHHYDNVNPYDVLIVDSPINFMSTTRMGKVERISEGYMRLKDYISNRMKRSALCIVTAQLKQSAVDDLRKNPSDTIDVTAGGESAETIRTPDEIIGLFSSKNERALGQMKMYSVGSRHSGNFEDFYVGCELGCGYFFSNPSLNE